MTEESEEVKHVEQEEESTQKKEKKKNPKRVEQGQKLAEWNRKNKKEAPAQNALAQENPKYWILGGGALVITWLYFTDRETQVLPQETQIVQLQQVKPEPTYDSFVMD